MNKRRMKEWVRVDSLWASQVALEVKNPPASVRGIRDEGSIFRSGRSPGGVHGHPLQHSCLDNPTDRGAWRIQPVGRRVVHDRSDLACKQADSLWPSVIHVRSLSSRSPDPTNCISKEGPHLRKRQVNTV